MSAASLCDIDQIVYLSLKSLYPRESFFLDAIERRLVVLILLFELSDALLVLLLVLLEVSNEPLLRTAFL
jgi:hypothetical protein